MTIKRYFIAVFFMSFAIFGIEGLFSSVMATDDLSDLNVQDLAPLATQSTPATPPPAPKPLTSQNPLLKGADVGNGLYVGDLQFQGFAISADNRLALVSDRSVRVGDEILGYAVSAITPSKIVLRQGERVNPLPWTGGAAMGEERLKSAYLVAFEGVDLKTALRFLSTVGHFNLIAPEDVGGMVTVTLEDVTIEDAAVAILKANGLDYAIENGVFRVGKGESFTGSGEDLKAETFMLRYASAKELQTQVKPLLSARGSAIADERTNTLTVKDSQAALDQIHGVIETIDIKDKQVLIEAKIIEASRDFSRDIGIQWGVNSSGNNRVDASGVTVVGQSQGGRPLMQNAAIASPVLGTALTLGRLAGGTRIDIQLQAAEQNGKARIIASPSIVTTNGKIANIRSGETLLIPVNTGVTISASSGTTGTTVPATGTTSGTGASVQQISTGIQLNVTPQISLDRHIKMAIEAITSQADFSRLISGVPVLVDNRATTTVMIRDQETTVIGGLVQNNTTLNARGVPYVSHVPLFGNLFKSKSRKKTNSEMIVFIKPTILDDTAIASPVASPPSLEPTALQRSVAHQAEEAALEEAEAKPKKALRLERVGKYEKLTR